MTSDLNDFKKLIYIYVYEMYIYCHIKNVDKRHI